MTVIRFGCQAFSSIVNNLDRLTYFMSVFSFF